MFGVILIWKGILTCHRTCPSHGWLLALLCGYWKCQVSHWWTSPSSDTVHQVERLNLKINKLVWNKIFRLSTTVHRVYRFHQVWFVKVEIHSSSLFPLQVQNILTTFKKIWPCAQFFMYTVNIKNIWLHSKNTECSQTISKQSKKLTSR